MSDTSKSVDRLAELSGAATQGLWGQFGLCNGPWQKEAAETFRSGNGLNGIDTSHHVSTFDGEKPYRIAEFHHADDAAFAESLVNAYRSGKLVWKDGEATQ